ncbi:MAG TPA: radical SAM protein [Elusimicrobiota bacterium]|nr:radical SAM protein [Elusimicrobiota bacterium]
MKIALVQCPVWGVADPPLGPAQLAGCLKAAGHEVRVFDLNVTLWRKAPPRHANLWLWEMSRFWNSPEIVDRFFADNRRLIESSVQAILRSGARVVAFSVNDGSQWASLKVSQWIKEADASRVVVFGGQYFFKGTAAEEILKVSGVDAVLRGPAEESLPALAGDVETFGRPRRRPGLLFRENGSLVDGGPASVPALLDKLPFADFTGFPLKLYAEQGRIPLSASRGCVWACHFCSAGRFWPNYSYMSGDRIFAEVKHQRSLFPSRRHVEFYDITANGRPEALRRFSELMIEERLAGRPAGHTGWKINAIVRPEMTPDLLRKMKAAGCLSVIYGIESGSPGVLKRMNKHYSLPLAERVLADTHAAGIHTTANFMVGFPGETEEDFQRTLDFLKRNKRSLDRAYPSATFTSLEEHSPLAENYAAFGIESENGRRPHNLYWKMPEGNDYPVRLERYKKFRALALRLGIDRAKGLHGDLASHAARDLAAYHRYAGAPLRALALYRAYLRRDPGNGPVRHEMEELLMEISGKKASAAVPRGCKKRRTTSRPIARTVA